MAVRLWLNLSLLLQLACIARCKIGSPVVSRFQLSSKGEEFQHLVIDPSTGRLYAGATNALYQLDDYGTLMAAQRFQTGPELDSPLCSYNGDCILWSSTASKKPSFANKTLTSNYNQILLLYPSRKALIACGTLKQGVCTMHRLENISRTFSDLDRSVPVAANSVNATTAAFLGPDQANSPVLYVASTFTYDAYRDAFPAVCTRTLDENRPFQLVDPGDVIGQSGLMIRNEYRSDFRVYYVGGFHFENYAFWLSVQRKSAVDSASPFVSKLLRVCIDDVRYETYSELPLECLGAENLQYNIMRAFYVGRLGLSDRSDDQEQYLVGVFTKAVDPWKIDARQRSFQSAVCAFSLKDIRTAFMFSLQRCNSGIGKWNLPHFGFDQKCHNVSSQWHRMPNRALSDQDSCQPLRIGSDMPATSAALITYFGPLLTSITADVIGDRTVLFVGTNEGKLKKINLQTVKNGREYGEIQLSTDHGPGVVKSRLSNWTSAAVTAVNPDMVFDSSRRHLYVMTNKELLKVAFDSCGSYETCDTCLASGDPYCGWCVLEKRCSRKEDCAAANVHHGFLPSNVDDLLPPKSTCPVIETVSPMNASLYTPVEAEVTLTFNFLPPPLDGGVYRCLFGVTPVSAVVTGPRTLKCHLPPLNERPKKSANPDSDMDTLQLRLKLWSSASSAVFYETPFVFYDCGAHKRCTSCVSSKWDCGWCITENKCVDTSDPCNRPSSTVHVWPGQHLMRHYKHYGSNTRKAFMLDTLNNGGGSANRLVSQCPHIDISDLPEVLLPSGESFAIQVPVVNLDKLPASRRIGSLDCVLVIERKEIRVRGWLAENGKTVLCESHEYSYETESRTAMADFYLQPGNGAVIDQMKVQLYKCEILGPDCTRCWNMDRRYHCGWCNDQCQHRKACSTIEPEHAETCPAPTIKGVSPLAGPVEGGTRVEILGFDLGSRREDVEGRISIGGRVLCDVVEYSPAERIVCITRAFAPEFEGPVEIRLGNNQQGIARSQQSFRFVQPSLDGFHPNIGPRAGGTEVLISGTHLLDATRTEVFIGPLPCKVDRWKSTSERLVCKTTALNEDQQTFHELTVILDRANRSLAARFDYTPDPRVVSIQPLVSFKSGGRQLVVRGRYFNSVQRPLMFFLCRQTGRLESENSICQVFNATLLLCPSPALLPNRANRLDRRALISQDASPREATPPPDGLTAEVLERLFSREGDGEVPDLSSYDRYNVGFIMDNVESLKRLNDFSITVVPDPVYLSFPNGRKLITRGEPLILDGTDLDLSSSEIDVRVTVGGELCKVTLISTTRLVCQPPFKEIDEDRSKLIIESNVLDPDDVGPLVVVRVGYLEFVLGRLVYDNSDAASMLLAGTGGSAVWDAALAGAVIGVCVTLSAAAVLALALWWRQKILQAEKEYERVRQQMDSLESNVRQECKQAFTELQTEISELITSGIGSQGLPYHSRQTYAEKILFRGDNSPKAALDWQEYDDLLGDSITSFEEILRNQHFLSTLIDVLEREQTIGPGDRVCVAGLLTASLADDMHTLTELILALLRDATLKNACRRFQSEEGSILDALLTNWVSLSMYDYLVGSEQGKALFLLHKALQCQSEMGPIDSATGHARYSLSEENLLKEQLEFESIVLRIIPPSVDNDCEIIPCRVLTCDTIGQVKSKILDALYKNAPFSSRPSIDDVELEWKSSQSRTGIFLQDDVFNGTGTTSCKEHWRQLNTVQHYGIPDHAVVAMFLKMRSNYPYADDSTHTYMSISSSTYLLSGSSLSSNSSPNGNASALSRPKRYSSASTQCPRSSNRPVGSIRYWHLVKPTSFDSGYASRTNGCVPEIYFTRLLATKGTVQKYIDDFFDSLFTNVDSSFPPFLKFLFDFVNDGTSRLSFIDSKQLSHAWKSSCYFLKFWSHLIQNVDSLFDVERKAAVQSCMAVIEQVLVDICTYPDERLGKDSPSNKLLFARDLPRYRLMLARFYADIGKLPRVDECDLRSEAAQKSKSSGNVLQNAEAVHELFAFIVRYREQVLEALSVDQEGEMKTLQQRFEHISAWAGRQSVV